MRNLFAPGNQWVAKVERLYAQLKAANEREAELRSRVHELELMLAATDARKWRVVSGHGRGADAEGARWSGKEA